MNRLNDTSIGARLGGAFASVVAVVIATPAIAKLRVASMAEDVQRLVADNDVRVSLAAELADGLVELGMAARVALLADDVGQRGARLQAMESSRRTFAPAYGRLDAVADDELGLKRRLELKAVRAECVGQSEAFGRQARAGDAALARAHLVDTLQPQHQACRRALGGPAPRSRKPRCRTPSARPSARGG